MKKNKFMRLAYLFLVAVLASSCFLGNTFAKYSTQGDSFDSARVAMWGVTITAPAADRFKTEYKTGNTVTVKTTDTSKHVLAPGTNGACTKYEITGTPETAISMNFTPVVTLNETGHDDWVVDGSYYCPIVFTVTDKSATVATQTVRGCDYGSIDAFLSALNAAIDKYDKTYAPGAATLSVPVISWVWAYEGTTGTNHSQTDAKDTALMKAATRPQMRLGISVSITQVD